MENCVNQESDYQQVTETLLQTFGQVFSEDVIAAIVEECGGDLNESANAIMNMTDDIKTQDYMNPPLSHTIVSNSIDKGAACSNDNVRSDDYQNLSNFRQTPWNKKNRSYANIIAQPAQRFSNIDIEDPSSNVITTGSRSKLEQSIRINNDLYSIPQIRNILIQHNKGNRILIIMRGVPGSGKSYMAKKIIEMTIGTYPQDFNTHILSTDDYFMVGTVYSFEKNRLHIAHEWNQLRARDSMTAGLSPVIIDNTNIMAWELEPYVRIGLQNGYLIEVVEPNTPWARRLHLLSRKNTHGVPVQSVKRMLENYENGINGYYIMKMYKLSYPRNMLPPVRRNIPPVDLEPLPIQTVSEEVKQNIFLGEPKQTTLPSASDIPSTSKNYNNDDSNVNEVDQHKDTVCNEPFIESKQDVKSETTLFEQYTELENQLDEFTKIEQDWEQGESCNDKLAKVEQDWEQGESCNDKLAKVEQDWEQVESCNDEFAKVEQDWEQGESWNDEFTKVEQDWEQGESWNDDAQTIPNKIIEDHLDKHVELSKPQRIIKSKNSQQTIKNTDLKSNFSKPEEHETVIMNFELKEISGSTSIVKKSNNDSDSVISSNVPKCSNNLMSESATEELLSNADNFLGECQDWTKISMFMPPWEDETKLDDKIPAIVVEKVDSSTCVEIGDTDISNTNKPYKLLPVTARDINLYYVPTEKEKIPEKRMLDKSSMTNEQMLSEGFRCKYENRHFKTFRKMFKNIAKADLRDVFDHCCGDVNWAVSIVLDGMANKQLSVLDTEDSSASDDEITEQCECLAAYDIIPNMKSASSPSPNSDSAEGIPSESTPKKQRKSKKDVGVSESSVKLKRHIEKNFVIPDSHYSEYFLKVRKLRRGELNKSKTENLDIDSKNADEFAIPSTSKVDIDASSSSSENQGTNPDSEVGDNSDRASTEKIINFDIGNVFVYHLDEFYGRQGFEYPPNVQPKINIPISLLNEINALWMESVLDQFDQSSKQTELMIKQDEEFARQLALKEAEMAQAGKEPEVPDLKEIMDMEFALSLYQKDVAKEWRNKEPNSLAAKLTRDKLFNLFPDISPDVLSELLMAHDHNFQATLESLFLSTGMGEVLKTKNGVNKYVMQKELERQEKIIAEQKKALSETEWPYLPKGQKVDMSVVDAYRKEADMHLKRRTMIYQKAQEYISRGMTQVASYYSDIADLHTRKFEYANSLAATYLIQAHTSRCKDDSFIDLHYLRVGEALETLDLFLDSHIRKIRDSSTSNKIRTLFFVTGRGLHSAHGQPKIKPATKRRLMERGIICKELNPGLLTAKVTADHLLSNQVA